MILSTCGASAVVFHTTSLCWRAAWARRTSHQGGVVARTTAVLPACCKMSRRVSIFYLRSPLHAPALEDQKHECQQQDANSIVKELRSRHRLPLLIPRVDFRHLLVRLFDRLLSLPALHQH